MNAPRWLERLERYLGWMAIPQIAVLIITLQILGFLFVMSDPSWGYQLALLPDAVLAGEVWRLVTFLALPLSMSVFWMIFVLWFLYFILNALESQWGAFRTTFYILVSWAVTVAYSLIFWYPVTSIAHFESTLFFAAAALFPEYTILVFMIVPAKMKWLAWFSGAFVLLEIIRGDWLDRFYLVAIYSNFLLFFGPAAISSIRQRMRRNRFKRQMRS